MTAIRRKKSIFHLSYEQRNAVRGYRFILPWLIGFLVFYAGCLVQLGEFSLSKIGLDAAAGMTKEYVGFSNYIEAFTSHATFKQTLTSSLIDMMIDLPMIIFFSLFVAMMLNRKFKGRAVVRAIFFLPVILSADAVGAAITRAMELMNVGVSSTSQEMTMAGGVSVSYYIQLFGDLALPPALLEYIVGAVNRIATIIKGSGVQIILFIAALQSIPGSLYEVAKIEGATGYETLWKVTIPMLMPHIITNTIYTLVDRFTTSQVVQLANETYQRYNYGLSSVFSLTSTMITILILGLIVYLLNKRAFYYTLGGGEIWKKRKKSWTPGRNSVPPRSIMQKEYACATTSKTSSWGCSDSSSSSASATSSWRRSSASSRSPSSPGRTPSTPWCLPSPSIPLWNAMRCPSSIWTTCPSWAGRSCT